MVFPEPVRLEPIMERPERRAGMQPFWIEVGWRMEREAREARSQGATSRVAKLDLESTVLPLLTVAWEISAGFEEEKGRGFRGLMRDVVAGSESAGNFSFSAMEASDVGDSLRLFLEGRCSNSLSDCGALLESETDASLSEDWEDTEALRIRAGMIVF